MAQGAFVYIVFFVQCIIAASGHEVAVSNAESLATALLDTKNVSVITLAGDIDLESVRGRVAALSEPVLILSNLTIRGQPGLFPVLNGRFIGNAIRWVSVGTASNMQAC